LHYINLRIRLILTKEKYIGGLMNKYSSIELKAFLIDKLTFRQYANLLEHEKRNGLIAANITFVSKSSKLEDMYLRFLVQKNKEDKSRLQVVQGNPNAVATYRAKLKLV
jgi:hypothetical protein